MAGQEPNAVEDADCENTSLAGLAEVWEKDSSLRGHLLAKGTLLAWPSDSQVGVISFKTMSLNAPLLEHLLRLWCPQLPTGKTVVIDHVREQAELLKHVVNQNQEFKKNTAVFVAYFSFPISV